MKVTKKTYTLKEWFSKHRYSEYKVQFKIVKYSEWARAYKAMRKHGIDPFYHRGMTTKYLQEHKRFYIVYDRKSKERVEINEHKEDSIKVISIEKFLENLNAWQLLKKL